jgi:hypothetical protein
LSRFFLTLMGGSLLTAIPAAAQISGVNPGSLNDTVNATGYTLAFDAGNGGTAVTKLIVSTGTESGSAAQITDISATWNGTRNFTVAVALSM